ncbi:MAG: hypothetical protein HZA53_17610 [Planctomycetes bacterium]|nr:hypothetical protein [Planctomycetota bacterium]
MDRRREDDPKLPASLETGLGELFRPRAGERTELDQRVARAAREHFDARRRVLPGPGNPPFARTWALRAAAVLVLALGGWVLVRSISNGLRTQDVARADRDGNGRVDVLDAFQLAREVERGVAEARWDVDGNGRVDREDAHAIAVLAVRIGS